MTIQQNGRGTLWDGGVEREASLPLREEKKWFRKRTHSHLAMLETVFQLHGRTEIVRGVQKEKLCTKIFLSQD